MLCSTAYYLVGIEDGARRVDHVIGVVVDIMVDGKIVKTVSNSPKVLQQHEEKKIIKTNISTNQF